MNCKVCGAKVREGAAFCVVCGTPLDGQESEEVVVSPADEDAEAREMAEAFLAPEDPEVPEVPATPEARETTTTHDGMQITMKAPRPGDSPSYAVRPPAPAGYAGPPNPGIPAEMIGAKGAVSQQPAPQPLTRKKPRKKQRKGIVTLVLCGLCLLGAVVFEVVGAVIATLFDLDLEFFTVAFGAIGACGGIALMRGGELIMPSRKSLREAWDEGGWWVIAVACGLLAFEIADFAMNGDFVLASDWPLRVIGVFVLCMFIGLGEEGMFRGLLYGGLLDAFGGKRKGLFAAAIVSSTLFGMAHVEWWDLDYSSLSQVLQAIFKILQTGTYGFFLASLTTRTKSIVGPAFIHGLDDFILLFPSVGLMGDPLETEYVSTGDDGFFNVGLYIIVILLYMPLVIQGIRLFMQTKLPEHGPFHRS